MSIFTGEHSMSNKTSPLPSHCGAPNANPRARMNPLRKGSVKHVVTMGTCVAAALALVASMALTQQQKLATPGETPQDKPAKAPPAEPKTAVAPPPQKAPAALPGSLT